MRNARFLIFIRMSYLLDLVQSFDEKEMQQFRQLDLIGKEELLRDEYAGYAKQKNFNEATLASKLKLTQSHFDKINSVLLSKIIQRLFGDDYRKILIALLVRGKTALLLHQLKIMQRKVLKEKIAGQDVQFYRAAFDSLSRMFHPNYNSKLTHEYGNKYLDALGKQKTIEHEAYVALFAHYGDMIAQNVAGNELQYQKQARQLLETWKKKLAAVTNPSVHAYYHFVLGNYYKYYTNDVELFIKAQEDGVNALKTAPEETNNLLLGRLLCESGYGYMEKNEFDRAQSYYEKAFALTNEQFAKSNFHAGNYFFVCLCNSQPQKAKDIFNTYLQPFLHESVNSSVRFDMTNNKFILSLHLKDYETAYEYLSKMRSYKKNELTHYGNILIRFSETLYYFLQHDYRLTASLAKKNLKFLHLPENMSPQFNYHRQYIDCIDKLIKRKQGKLRFPEKLDEQMASLQQGIFYMYNLLLRNASTSSA